MACVLQTYDIPILRSVLVQNSNGFIESFNICVKLMAYKNEMFQIKFASKC